jgi:translation elongation factor EF-1alpha
MHAIIEEAEIVHIIQRSVYDFSQGSTQVIKKPKLLKSLDTAKVVVRVKRPICLEKFENVMELGRFSMRIN